MWFDRFCFLKAVFSSVQPAGADFLLEGVPKVIS